MSEVLTRLLTDLNQGKQLSDCLKEFPDLFDRLYINLVALGEAGGRLPEVFRGLAEELRFRRELREKVISAVTYPAVIVGVCIISIYFILNFVVPNLAGLFSGVTDLPWYTAMLLSSSEIARDWQLPILMALVLSGLWLWRTRKSPYVSGVFERIMLEWPGLRYATVSVERVRFSSGLAMMLDAGLPVDRALSLAAGNVERAVIQRELFDAVERIKRGEQISSALGRTRLFPEYLVSLLEVGEESGALARVFAEIARRGRNDFSAWALRLTTLLEPIMILVMGGIVGGVVVIMMLSITSVTEVGF
jgi:type II secretory pathway component PulF